MPNYCLDTLFGCPSKARRSPLLAFALCSGVILASAVQAAAPAPLGDAVVATAKIAYVPGDAGTEARLRARIDAAALEVCGASADSFADYVWAVRRSDCWRDSVADAINQLRNAQTAAERAAELAERGGAPARP